MTTKKKWEKTARGARLVETEVLGSFNKTKRGANWKRADGARGSAKSQRVARAAVEGKPAPRAPAPAPSRSSSSKAKPAPLALTAANLYAQAAKVGPAGRFHSQVFLGPLLERFGTTPQAVRDRLVALHQNEEITLSRADLVDAMDAAVVRRSEITGPAGYRFHLLSPL